MIVFPSKPFFLPNTLVEREMILYSLCGTVQPAGKHTPGTVRIKSRQVHTCRKRIEGLAVLFGSPYRLSAGGEIGALFRRP